MDAIELLKYINPSELDYQEWINVGMILKDEGYPCSVWDDWSRADARYKPNDCTKRWDGFDGAAQPVTIGTLYEYAMRGGYEPDDDGGYALDWDSEISKEWDENSNEDYVVVHKGYAESCEIEEPDYWDPVDELTLYLKTLFQADENVGYVVDVYQNGDRLSPKKGCWDRTAGQLIEELQKTKDIGAVLGDFNPAAGAWIRFNPLDGNGIKNENVTEYRYALVESDSIPIGEQIDVIRKLKLPVACLVFSGKKSVHAIVKVQAATFQEYRERVEFLYSVCNKNGLKVDQQNKNPSRLSRMPGVTRCGHKQFLIGINEGLESWTEWKDWIDGVNDDLPNMEVLDDAIDNIPPLADCLIEGILRKGHKMILAGPPKAGKSFALIALAIAISEGREWFGFQCAQGKVLYVNLELDRASCLHRFVDVRKAMGIDNPVRGNIHVWNLRGKSETMDKLVPKLIRRAKDEKFIAVIIDPVYKVITGDENSAEQMAFFCNQFDKICTQLNAATIYCHHHSKGAQGGKKSMDRASGSGVFSRDADAMLDMAELTIPDDERQKQIDAATVAVYNMILDKVMINWYEGVPKEDLENPVALRSILDNMTIPKNQRDEYDRLIIAAIRTAKARTAWRIEGTLREFAPFDPLNLWFEYPVHRLDVTGLLTNLKVDDGQTKQSWQSWRKDQVQKGKDTTAAYLEAIEELFEDGAEKVHYKDVAGLLGKSERTVQMDFTAKGRKHKKRIEDAGYTYDNGFIIKTQS